MNKLEKELNGKPLWGLPKRISDEIINSYELTIVRVLGPWLYIALMIGGFAVGGYLLWPWLEGQNNSNAIRKAAELGGLMYDVNFGIGLLIALFIWIMGALWLTIVIVRLSPMPIKGALSFSMLADSKLPENNDKKCSEILKEHPRIETASELLNEWADTPIIKLGKFLIPVALFASAVSYREIHTFSVYGNEGFVRSAFFEGENFRPWTDVKTVELGCNQTDDGGSLVYKIRFADGKSIRIEDGIPINNSRWLDNIEQIDTKIASGNAEFKRWSWMNRDPLHPKCLRGYYGEFNDADTKRFKKLLRIDTL